jgi:NAD(P)H-flavin reductase
VRETADTVTFHLSPPDGAPFVFAPGQFNMLYLFGIGEVAISISGASSRRREIVHTLRAVGSVTRPLAALRRGAIIGLRGPYGSSWPVGKARGRDVVLVAGGIGLAPLRPVVYEVLRRRNEFGRVALLYGARRPSDLLYVEELRRWSAGGIEVSVTVDHADPSWRGDVGVVTALFERIAVDPARSVAMMCGPEVMMRFALRELEQRGFPTEALYVSLERNMKCAAGLCGRCQFGPMFICKDGPVLDFPRVAPFFGKREF